MKSGGIVIKGKLILKDDSGIEKSEQASTGSF